MKSFIATSFVAAMLITSCIQNPQPSTLNQEPLTTGPHTVAQTVYGPIQGFQDGQIMTFRGVPYAHAGLLVNYLCG